MSRRNRTLLRLLEFFLIGLVFGVIEDLLAIYFSTDAKITRETLVIVFLVALPFAIFSELIVDHPGFWKKLFRIKNGEEK